MVINSLEYLFLSYVNTSTIFFLSFIFPKINALLFLYYRKKWHFNQLF
jgi:hypothetical protein